MTSSHSEPPQDGVPPPVSGPAGESRPPVAPVVGRAWRHGVRAEHLDPGPTDRPTGRRRHDGPALERVLVGPAHRWSSAALWALGIEVVVVVVAAAAGWVGDPDPVLAAFLVGLFAVLFAWMFFREPPLPPISAGAGWVRSGDDGTPVSLHRLTEVLTHTMNGEPYLRLADARSALELHLGLVQANPQLWELVHAGVRASVARGATASAATREDLGLPEDGRT